VLAGLLCKGGGAGFCGKTAVYPLARGAIPPRDDDKPRACCMSAARCFAYVNHVPPVLAQVQQPVQQLKKRHGTE